jgi:universal stress protein A
MALYRSILIAVDLSENSDAIARHGHAMARVLGADVRLIHVVPPLPVAATIPPEPVVPAIVQTDAELLDTARERMMRLSADLDLPAAHTAVAVGEVHREIVRAARENATDLIVLGSHERHGASLLAHFTVEDKLLHRAPCDVLAVRVR